MSDPNTVTYEHLLSILTSDTWSYDSEFPIQITFNEDGTGNLVCLAPHSNSSLRPRFAFLHPHSPNPIRLHTLPRRKPHIVAEFRIEITLTKKRVPIFPGSDIARMEVNEFWFTDDAFRPKEYNICLREGRFFEPEYGLMLGDATFSKKYSLYLEFGPSPFPPQHEWKEPDGAAQAVRLWYYTQFCGRELPFNAIQNHFYDNCSIM